MECHNRDILRKLRRRGKTKTSAIPTHSDHRFPCRKPPCRKPLPGVCHACYKLAGQEGKVCVVGGGGSQQLCPLMEKLKGQQSEHRFPCRKPPCRKPLPGVCHACYKLAGQEGKVCLRVCGGGGGGSQQLCPLQ